MAFAFKNDLEWPVPCNYQINLARKHAAYGIQRSKMSHYLSQVQINIHTLYGEVMQRPK